DLIQTRPQGAESLRSALTWLRIDKHAVKRVEPPFLLGTPLDKSFVTKIRGLRRGRCHPDRECHPCDRRWFNRNSRLPRNRLLHLDGSFRNPGIDRSRELRSSLLSGLLQCLVDATHRFLG